MAKDAKAGRTPILTPDQRLRVFVSSTLQELAEERGAAREAIQELRLAPIMFELGARPHPPRNLYRAYLEQSHVFIGIYWQRYGWVAPGETVSGLEDEYRLSGDRPKLIYIKTPAAQREPRLEALLARIQDDDQVSFKFFSTARELKDLLMDDLALLLTERFERAKEDEVAPEPRRGGLPVPPTPLVGREQEIASLRQLLLRQEVRLVTLYGPAGIGKSRLALQVAEELHFHDGVLFVSLASVHDPSFVPTAVAAALNVREEAGRPLLTSLKSYLARKNLLLVLDNFEQVLAAAPLVAELLASAPGLKFLVTSRSVLRLSGEHEVEVKPLALPDKGQRSAERLGYFESVRLFVERARAVKPHFDLTEDNAAIVAEICRRLDGLPLAIELAAARVKVFSPQAMLSRLVGAYGHTPLRLLTGGARDLPERQRTLRSTLDWSYNLLEEVEHVLFSRLAVFAGGFSLSAAEAVCNVEGSLDVLEGVSSLVGKSLSYIGTSADEPRFFMLETIREYALERLGEHDQAEEVRRRHAHFFLELAEEAEPRLTTQEQALWLKRLAEEHDNLRAALAHEDVRLRLAAALWRFWMTRGHLSEGRKWLELALASGRDREGSLRAKALSGAGNLAWNQGDYAVARSFHEESLALRRKLGNKQDIANSLNDLGNVASLQGDYMGARSLFEQSLAIKRELGDTWGIAASLNNLGNVVAHQGDHARARSFYEESLVLRRALGDRWGVAASLNNLGLVAHEGGDYASARSFHEESLALRQELGDELGIATSLNNLGLVAHEEGDYLAAKSFYGKSLALLQEVGDKRGMADGLEGLAIVVGELGEPRRAALLLGAAEALREAIGAPLWPADRPRYERALERVRGQLNSSAFREAWREGRVLELEEALEVARGA